MMQQAFAAPFSINGADVIPVVETPEEVRSSIIAPVVNEALEESFYTISSASTWRSIYYNGSQIPTYYSNIGLMELDEYPKKHGQLFSDFMDLDEYPKKANSLLTTPDNFPVVGWGSYPIPRAAKIESDEPESIFGAEKQPISLHYGYSLTFEALEDETTLFLLDVTGPTLLRIFVRDSAAAINVNMFDDFDDPNYDVSFAAYGHSDLFFTPAKNGLYYIKVTSDAFDSSLVSIIPFIMDNDDYKPIEIPANSSIAGVLESPYSHIDRSSDIIYSENRPVHEFFSAEIVKGRCYRIVVDIESRSSWDTGFGGFRTASYTFAQIEGNISWMAGSGYDQDGLTFQALSNDVWIGVLTVYADVVDYIIYFQEVPCPEIEDDLPTILALNTPYNISDSEGKSFKFMLPTASMVAFNFTNDYSTIDLDSIYHWVDSETSNYIPDSYLNPIEGNLFGDFLGQMVGGSVDWLWLPSGNVTFVWDTIPATEFEVFAIPVQSVFSTSAMSLQSPSKSAVNFAINEATILALELPMDTRTIYELMFNDTSQLNQSVQYEYGIFQKGLPNSKTPGAFELGNYLALNGSWLGYGTTGNGTRVYQSLHYWDLMEQIILLRPYIAYNLTFDGDQDEPQDEFSATLRVEFGPSDDPAGISVDLPYSEYYVGWPWDYLPDSGFFIPESTVLTPGSSAIFQINNDIVLEDRQLLAIPLGTSSGSLYNITAVFTGNFTPTTPNVTFSSLSEWIVSSGNIGDSTVWHLIDSIHPDGETIRSSLFIANDSTSILFLRIDRSYNTFENEYCNATLTISLSSIGAPALGLDPLPNLLDYYNPTPTDYEVKNEKSKDKDDEGFPGFGVATLLTGMTMIAFITIAKKRRNKE
jgi:hypothetical protein